MAAQTTNETWDAAWVTTARAERKGITDNIFDAYPLLSYMRKSGVIEVESGGKEFQENLMYGKNSAEWFEGYDVLNTDAVDGITAAFFNVRYVSVPITISFTEEQENRKASAAGKLISAKNKQSMLTIRDTVNAQAFGAQSGKSMLGLQDIVAAVTTSGTLGGINRANESWWRNQTNASGGNFNANPTAIPTGFAAMSALYNNCSEGNDEPDRIFTTLTLFGEWEDIIEGAGYSRYVGGAGSATVDASRPKFRNAVADYDRDCATGKMYFLNSKYIKFKVLRGVNFAKTPFRSPANQLARVAFVVLGCNFVTNNPRRLGQIDFT